MFAKWHRTREDIYQAKDSHLLQEMHNFQCDYCVTCISKSPALLSFLSEKWMSMIVQLFIQPTPCIVFNNQN